ncbi:MAG: hypothetical protein HW405_500, partial [Candidatus Berkelbacteria bacterium]|nr:hypothetical protein [Candidatus Berkelbacteria bacterium]
PRSTFDCPSLCRLSALFQEGHSPTLEEIRPLIAAKFAAGRVTVQDLVQIALDFLAPKYKQGLTQETIEEVIGKTPATPEILRMALAVQILDEAWRSDFFDWYNVTRN